MIVTTLSTLKGGSTARATPGRIEWATKAAVEQRSRVIRRSTSTCDRIWPTSTGSTGPVPARPRSSTVPGSWKPSPLHRCSVWASRPATTSSRPQEVVRFRPEPQDDVDLRMHLAGMGNEVRHIKRAITIGTYADLALLFAECWLDWFFQSSAPRPPSDAGTRLLVLSRRVGVADVLALIDNPDVGPGPLVETLLGERCRELLETPASRRSWSTGSWIARRSQRGRRQCSRPPLSTSRTIFAFANFPFFCRAAPGTWPGRSRPWRSSRRRHDRPGVDRHHGWGLQADVARHDGAGVAH